MPNRKNEPSDEALADARRMMDEVSEHAGLGTLGPEGPDLDDIEHEQIYNEVMSMRRELDSLKAWRKRVRRFYLLGLVFAMVLGWSLGIWMADQ